MALLHSVSIDGNASEVQNLAAGQNVTLTPNGVYTIIDAKDTTYSQGEGIEISAANVIRAVMNATNTYTKTEVDAIIGALEHVRMTEVATLPATGQSNVIYLVPKSGGGHEMYVWDSVNNRFVDVGSDDVDLSNYVQKTQMNSVSVDGLVTKGSGQANKVWKTDANGDPAWRDDADTKYSAGTGLSLSGTTFSASMNPNNTYTKTQTDAAINNQHKVVLKTLTVAGWVLSGTTYQQTLSFNNIYNEKPIITACGSTLGSLATDAQYAALSTLKVLGDTTAKTMTFYANTAPTVAINLSIQGVS